MARAVYHYSKYHPPLQSSEELSVSQQILFLQIEFMHVEFKKNAGFQEAFECGMTKDEWQTYEEYLMRFYKILEQ